MYSNPPATASVAEVSTAVSRCSNRRGAKDVGDGDRRRLQKYVLLLSAAAAPIAPALDPEDGVAVLAFQNEAQLHFQLVHATRQGMHFVGLVGDGLQLGVEVRQAVLQPKILVAVFLQEFRAILEGEAALARRNQREEELRALPHIARRCQHSA